MMNIINKTSNDYLSFDKYFNKLLSMISDELKIEKFIISSKENYGLIISELDPNGNFTCIYGHRGFGKTIFNINENYNSIIIRE